MSACVLVFWALEATEKSTRTPRPTNRLNSARGSHHTLPDRPRSTASPLSGCLCKLRRIRAREAGQPISGQALNQPARLLSYGGRCPNVALQPLWMLAEQAPLYQLQRCDQEVLGTSSSISPGGTCPLD